MRFVKVEKIAARVAMGALALVSLLSMTANTLGTGGREALSEDAATCAVLNGPGCSNRAGAKRRSGGHFKGCVCFGADAQRLGNSGQGYERFCVHGGAVMDGQH